MIIPANETIAKKLLYLEDLPFYCSNLKDHLKQNPLPNRQFEVVPAYCLEQGYAFLKKHKVDGIIVDLHIPRCNLEQLADCQEQLIDLRNHAASFPGLGLLLMMQHSHEWIIDIPKLILTDHSFESYVSYYERLKGPKSHRQKEDFDEVNKTITEWLANI
jgi:DNA-binding NarL/FixJ family response regulator